MRRRPGISAGHSSISWAGKHVSRRVGATEVVPSSPPPVVETPAVRVRHAVITPQHSLWYRVLRGYKGTLFGSYGVNWEVIGEFPTALEATAHARAEAGHAIVNDWHSRRIYINGQPIEVRDAETD